MKRLLLVTVAALCAAPTAVAQEPAPVGPIRAAALENELAVQDRALAILAYGWHPVAKGSTSMRPVRGKADAIRKAREEAERETGADTTECT